VLITAPVDETTAREAGSEDPALVISGLSKRYGDREILRSVDLAVPQGGVVALIGANGTGKSTLLRSIVRLVEPTGGTIRALGLDVTALDRRQLAAYRSRVGFIFQRHNLVPRLSALTNVVHGVQARARGPRTWLQSLARNEVRQEALDCLAAVGLADLALQRADSLSGGQSQRVAIARTLMQRPELILADEPDASLDPKAGVDVMGLLYRLAKEKNLTLVLISHHMEHAIRFADRIVGLGDGGVALDIRSADADPHELRRFFDGDPRA
jgi:phosphonate transport system ATP-binding protein